MPITITDGSELIGATEHSLPRDAVYAAASPQTDICVLGVTLNVSDLALGDEVQLTIYETIASEQLPVYRANIAGPQSTSHFAAPNFTVGSGWDVTLKWISGTERTISWRLSVLTGDSASTIATAVLDAVYEGSRTVRGFFRVARSILINNAVDLTTAPKFKDDANTKNRVSFTMSGSNAIRTPTVDET